MKFKNIEVDGIVNRKIHSVKYNFIMNFILTATQFIFPLITFPYVARVLEASGNGRVTFAASVANYFMMVASLGIPTYGVRACARARADREKLTKTVHELFIINFIVTMLVTITFVISIYVIPRFSQDKTLFYINGINIVLNMFGMNWVYQALEQYDYITFRSIAFKLISIILMFLLVHQKSDYVIYGAITVFAAVGSYVLNFIRIQKIIDFKYYGPYNLRQHLKPIFTLFAQSVAVSIYTNLDTVMLGFMKTDNDVGYYNTAVKIKGLLLSLVTSLGNVLLPRMSYFVKNKMMDMFMEYMVKALNFELLMSLSLTLYFVLFSKESINFLAGPGYAGAIIAMQIITVAVIPNGLTGVLGVQVLTSLEKEKYVLYSVIVGAVVDFFLNLILIPQFGAAGAALATTIAEFLVLLVQFIYTRDLLREIKNSFRWYYYVLLTCIAGGVAYFVKLLWLNDFFILLISAIVFFGIYGIGLLLVREPILVDMLYIVREKIKK